MTGAVTVGGIDNNANNNKPVKEKAENAPKDTAGSENNDPVAAGAGSTSCGGAVVGGSAPLRPKYFKQKMTKKCGPRPAAPVAPVAAGGGRVFCSVCWFSSQ